MELKSGQYPNGSRPLRRIAQSGTLVECIDVDQESGIAEVCDEDGKRRLISIVDLEFDPAFPDPELGA